MNEKINIGELSNIIKKFPKESVKNDTLLNYSLLEKTISLSDKIKTYGNKCLYAQKLNDNFSLIFYSFKCLKLYYKYNNNKELLDTDSFVIGKALYRVSLFIKKSYPLFSFFYLYLSREIISNLPKLDIPEYKLILNSFKEDYKNEFFQEKKQIFSENNDLLEKIQSVFDENEEKENEDLIYIIDKNWYNNCKLFVNEVLLGKNIDNYFDEKDIKNNWIKGNNFQYNIVYCGPINNYKIIDIKDFWYDPVDKYTNVYLKKNLDKNDYIILPQSKYNILKDNFEIYDLFEIQRHHNCVELIQMKILILSTYFFESKKENYMRRRYIQIPHNMSYEDFIKKIIRILDYNLYEDEEEEKINYLNVNVSIYYSNKKLDKKDLFTIIYSYNYNSTNLEIKIPDFQLSIINSEEDFKAFLENYNVKNTEIIIEINPNEIENTFFENTIKYQNSEREICKLCQTTLKENDNNNYIKCNRLPSCPIKYCSNNCKEQDSFHIKFHNSLNTIITQKFNINLLLSLSVDDFLNPNSKHGLTGLVNLGNTCFMNSAIQCLSNCELLTTYFISGLYKSEINKNNKFGTGGLIVSCYYDLLKKIWIEDKTYIHPINFKDLFGHFVKQFSGFSQQDSHEMLTFMLDNIHEDLNRNLEKKYCELKEQSDNESDEEASLRWWNYNLTRDNSIIVDLFYGQYKSTVECPICNKININYDNFMCLGLPINSHKSLNGFVYVINNKLNSARKVNLEIEKNDFADDIYKKINKDKKLIGIFCNEKKMYLCLLNNKISVYKIYKQSLNQLNEYNCQIIFYEFDNEEIENKECLFFIPMTKENNDDKPKILFYPRPFYFNLDDKIQKIYDKIRENYYKYYNEENSNFSDDKIKLKIINNLTPCSKSHPPCDYCKKKECNNCDFTFSKEDTIEKLINSQSKKRTFLIYIEIPYEYLSNKDLNNIKLFEEYNNDDGNFKKGKNLYTCFQNLLKKEKLDENNLWYCSNCKENRQALKQLQIYKLPRILIIQLKRFKNENTGFFFFDNKNDVKIDFPIYNLDLTDFIVSNKEKKKYVYDLFAVNQHFGISIGGHYTALCKNGDKWYNFDDEDISEITDKNLVSSNAYLLFYKLKN